MAKDALAGLQGRIVSLFVIGAVFLTLSLLLLSPRIPAQSLLAYVEHPAQNASTAPYTVISTDSTIGITDAHIYNTAIAQVYFYCGGDQFAQYTSPPPTYFPIYTTGPCPLSVNVLLVTQPILAGSNMTIQDDNIPIPLRVFLPYFEKTEYISGRKLYVANDGLLAGSALGSTYYDSSLAWEFLAQAAPCSGYYLDAYCNGTRCLGRPFDNPYYDTDCTFCDNNGDCPTSYCNTTVNACKACNLSNEGDGICCGGERSASPDCGEYDYCLTVISGGEYRINETLIRNETCMDIKVDNVVLNCQGHAIIGNGSGYGIITAYRTNVTIINCNISNFTVGIYLNHTFDSTVANNTVFNNSQYGIYALPWYNNTLYDNGLYENVLAGMYLREFVNSSVRNNTAYNNGRGVVAYNCTNLTVDGGSVYNNSISGMSVIDSNDSKMLNLHLYSNGMDLLVNNTLAAPAAVGAQNISFDNPLGNFDNFTALDLGGNVSASSAYSISYPQAFASPPSGISYFRQKLVNISALAGAVSIGSIGFRWDESELGAGNNESRFWLWLHNGSGWFVLNSTPDNATNRLSLSEFSPASEYGILEDNNSPLVRLLAPPNSTRTNNLTQNFSCNVSDALIANLTLYLWNSSNGLAYNATAALGGAENSTNWSYTLPYDGSFSWNCFGIDLAGNGAWSSDGNWSLFADATAPSGNLTRPANGTLSVSRQQEFNCSGADSLGLANITLFIWDNVSSFLYSNTTALSGTGNSTNWSYVFGSDGFFKWNCLVNDSLGNSAWANQSNFSLAVDADAPAVNLLSPASGTSSTSGVTLSCNASDAVAVANITIFVWSGGVEVYNSTAAGTGGTQLSASASPSLPLGSYLWNCLANDSVGDSNWSTGGNWSFTLAAPPAAPPSGGSTGGSFGGGTLLPRLEIEVGGACSGENVSIIVTGTGGDMVEATIRVVKLSDSTLVLSQSGEAASFVPASAGTYEVSASRAGYRVESTLVEVTECAKPAPAAAAPECTYDSECETNLCVNGSCKNCSLASECASNFCKDGRCANCGSDWECGAGFVCSAGTCAQMPARGRGGWCKNDSDCPLNESCVNLTCVRVVRVPLQAEPPALVLPTPTAEANTPQGRQDMCCIGLVLILLLIIAILVAREISKEKKKGEGIGEAQQLEKKPPAPPTGQTGFG